MDVIHQQLSCIILIAPWLLAASRVLLLHLGFQHRALIKCELAREAPSGLAKMGGKRAFATGLDIA